MSYVIDRRPIGSKKSAVNRGRFLRRYKDHIRRAVDKAVAERSITDLDSGESVTIPARDVHEPTLTLGQGGKRTLVLPGNREFASGDHIARPPGGGGGGTGEGEASKDGEGMDEFVFQVTQEEFLQYLFESLELPNLVKKQLTASDTVSWQRAGYSSVGVPAKLDIKRSMCQSKSRRMAMRGAYDRKIKALTRALEEAGESMHPDGRSRAEIEDALATARKRRLTVPFLDDMDLRFRLDVPKPEPSSKAVMFCLMDVSASMDQKTKDMAKRFFLLLHLFLRRHYEKTEVVFIRHHTTAREVDEQEFFYARETGGTIVSSALKLTGEIIAERYPVDQWNIYCAQASDGDSWGDDASVCKSLLQEQLLPLLQYFVYVEITTAPHQSLWHAYEGVTADHPDAMAQRRIEEVGDIYPVFRGLFEAEST